MNKSDLIEMLAEKNNIPLEEATRVVNTFFEGISQALLRGERVELRGFGSFKVRDYKGYTGRNPRTGDAVPVKPKKLPIFRPGKELKDFLNK